MTVNLQNAELIPQIVKGLQRPFSDEDVKWKPQAVKGDRALAICYVDARCVMDRLDEVVGFHNWQDRYAVLDNGQSVKCELSLRIGTDWITKEDVGSVSEQPDEGDRMKAAFSDALKRAAVKFGIGRHLYSLPTQWVPYDALKRKFLRDPRLPAEDEKRATPSEVAKLASLMGEMNIPMDATLKRFGVKELKEIEQSDCLVAIAKLEAIKREKGKS